MNDERIDFTPLDGAHDGAREDRVVRRVLAEVAGSAAPRRDLADAIVALGPAAVAAAAVLALVVRLGPNALPPDRAAPPTVGTALGLPAAAERVIRSDEPASGWELLTAFQEDR